MTSGADDPTLLPLAEVERRCARETERYRQRASSDPRFCLEIFRRALGHGADQPSQGDRAEGDDARTPLTRLYTSFIEVQIARCALRWCERDDIVQETWLRFWRAAPHLSPFPSLEAALAYLRRTATSAAIEATRRAWREQREASIEALMEEMGGGEQLDGGVDPVTEQQRQRMRARIDELLRDPVDRSIFWMRYSMGLAPREIAPLLRTQQQTIRGRAPTARLVSDCLERCIRILAEDTEIRDLLQSD